MSGSTALHRTAQIDVYKELNEIRRASNIAGDGLKKIFSGVSPLDMQVYANLKNAIENLDLIQKKAAVLAVQNPLDAQTAAGVRNLWTGAERLRNFITSHAPYSDGPALSDMVSDRLENAKLNAVLGPFLSEAEKTLGIKLAPPATFLDGAKAVLTYAIPGIGKVLSSGEQAVASLFRTADGYQRFSRAASLGSPALQAGKADLATVVVSAIGGAGIAGMAAWWKWHTGEKSQVQADEALKRQQRQKELAETWNKIVSEGFEPEIVPNGNEREVRAKLDAQGRPVSLIRYDEANDPLRPYSIRPDWLASATGPLLDKVATMNRTYQATKTEKSQQDVQKANENLINQQARPIEATNEAIVKNTLENPAFKALMDQLGRDCGGFLEAATLGGQLKTAKQRNAPKAEIDALERKYSAAVNKAQSCKDLGASAYEVLSTLFGGEKK